jgi:UDP-2,4-diacetamido-2,4,6-trideoxy-beta-L-altropyranose hydrolase
MIGRSPKLSTNVYRSLAVAKGLVIIRADASHFLGNGHVVRCVALAEALQERGISCLFACRDLPGNAIGWLQQQHFNVEILSAPEKILLTKTDDFTTWGQCDPRWDADNTAQSLSTYSADWVVIDHYAWSAPEHVVLQSLARNRLVIDDLCNRPLDADVIVDSGVRTPEDYNPWVTKPSHLLLGHDFLPLRKIFYERRMGAVASEQLQRHFIISCGATDPNNYSLQLLELCTPILSELDFQVTCVLAENAPNIASVEAFCRQYESCRLIINPENMALFIETADFILGTAGSSIWERCALGKPSAVFMAGADQEKNFETLVLQGGGCSIAADKNPCCIDPRKVISTLHAWCSGTEISEVGSLAQYQLYSRSLCDAEGARRIVQAMERVAA